MNLLCMFGSSGWARILFSLLPTPQMGYYLEWWTLSLACARCPSITSGVLAICGLLLSLNGVLLHACLYIGCIVSRWSLKWGTVTMSWMVAHVSGKQKLSRVDWLFLSGIQPDKEEVEDGHWVLQVSTVLMDAYGGNFPLSTHFVFCIGDDDWQFGASIWLVDNS